MDIGWLCTKALKVWWPALAFTGQLMLADAAQKLYDTKEQRWPEEQYDETALEGFVDERDEDLYAFAEQLFEERLRRMNVSVRRVA